MKSISVAVLFAVLAVGSAQPGYKYQQPSSAPIAPPANHHHEHHHHHQIGSQHAAPINGPNLAPQQTPIFSPIQSPPLQSFNPLPASQPPSIPLQPPKQDISLPEPQAPSQHSYLPPPQSVALPVSVPQSHQGQIVQQQVVHHQQQQQQQQQHQHHFGAAQLSQPIQPQQPHALNFPSGGHGGFQSNFQSFQQRPQSAIITKDIYIHSAPEDQEESELGYQLENSPIRKNYRIVFIKAPTPNLKLATAALKHAQNANEDKTVIYVLSKKPDLSEVQQQLQQSQSQQKSSKPEVYFIKYKNQEEAQRAQQEIQAQYDALGGSTHISDEGFAPVTSVSDGGLNLGSAIGQQHNSFIQQNFQSAVNYEGPNNKYLPIKKK